MSAESDLLNGVAALLTAECDPTMDVTWRADGTPYADGETGIYLEDTPATPDRVVTLSLYDLGDDPVYADSTRGLQIRCRGASQDPTEARDLDAALCDVLIGRWPATVGGVQIVTLTRTSGVSLGKDDRQRWSRTSNFELGLYLPGSHRL